MTLAKPIHDEPLIAICVSEQKVVRWWSRQKVARQSVETTKRLSALNTHKIFSTIIPKLTTSSLLSINKIRRAPKLLSA
jgi:hypothetical protein